MGNVNIWWRHLRGSSWEFDCWDFKESDPRREGASECPMYRVCSTPCDPQTAQPSDLNFRTKSAIEITFGERSCRCFTPFEDKAVPDAYGRLLINAGVMFCPAAYNCKNACFIGRGQKPRSVKGSSSPYYCHDGSYKCVTANTEQ